MNENDQGNEKEYNTFERDNIPMFNGAVRSDIPAYESAQVI